VIRFERVTITYADADRPVLRDVDLEVPAGELCVVVGATGTGKSTLLGAVNGLVPHFTGGTLRGRVSVDGRDTESFPPRELVRSSRECDNAPHNSASQPYVTQSTRQIHTRRRSA